MADIVIGLGTSHSPQCSTPAEQWIVHGERDRHNPTIPYVDLAARRGKSLASELTFEVWRAKYERCQQAVWRLADALTDAEPEVVIVVGDDQDELFSEKLRPAIALYGGSHIDDIPPGLSAYDPAIWPAYWARHGNEREAYPTDPGLAAHLAQTLACSGIDATWVTEQPIGCSLGHAFTFVRRRLMGHRIIPMVPLFINTYYPPNQPTVAQCWRLGETLREAVSQWTGCRRVALIASGGLSHFVIDEDLDRLVLGALEQHDAATLQSLDNGKLVSGTSEIRNWVAVGAALRHFSFTQVDYIPAYRTPAGTGMGMAFAVWHP